MHASSSHLAVSRNSSLSAWRFFFVNISRILLFRPFRNEAGDYFVNDSEGDSEAAHRTYFSSYAWLWNGFLTQNRIGRFSKYI